METLREKPDAYTFLKNLGFPEIRVHFPFNHFDFIRPSRRILVIGPMGSGKTEYSARVWRDSLVAKQKEGAVARVTSSGGADRRKVFFVRSFLDASRFPDYPSDALAYRGGYEACGEHIAQAKNSFELETIMKDHPEHGTWIIDEASFFDERLAYVIREKSVKRGLVFIFPTLILNFRKDIFNSTARLLLDTATDVFPLTAYCEHRECLADSLYTYRYYNIEGEECPALYFDPLIVIGGDTVKAGPLQPNYCTRCEKHHYLPGKEYTYLHLKPMGEAAAGGDLGPLKEELFLIKQDLERSTLYKQFVRQYVHGEEGDPFNMNALKVDCIAEKALMFLYGEQNLISGDQLNFLVRELDFDRAYMQKSFADNGRGLKL